jgi:AraC-like DNA-binding protein
MGKAGKPMTSAVFISYSLPYCILLLLVLLAVYLLFSYVTGLMRENTLRSHRQMMQAGVANVDARLQDLEAGSASISSSPENAELSRRNPTSSTYVTLYRHRSAVIGNMMSNEFVAESVLYFYASDILITSQHATARPETVYQKSFSILGVGLDGFRGLYRGPATGATSFYPAVTLLRDGCERRVIPYVHYVPYDNFLSPKAILIVFIDQATLFRYVNTFAPSAGQIYVLDRDGQLLASSDSAGVPAPLLEAVGGKSGSANIRLDGVSHEVMYETSARTGWAFVTAVPSAELFQSVHRIQSLLIFFVALLSALAFMAVIAIAVRRRRSMQSLDRLILETRGGRGRFGASRMAEAIKDLMDVRAALSERILQQNKLIARNFYFKLLAGGYYSEDDMRCEMQRAEQNLPKGGYIVAVCKLVEYSPVSLFGDEDEPGAAPDNAIAHVAASIRKTVLGIAKDACLFCDVSNRDDVSLLLYNKSLNAEVVYRECGETLERIFRALSQKALLLQAGVGTPAFAPLDIGLSSDNALSALNYACAHTEKTVYLYRDVPMPELHYYYPLEMETMLVNYCTSGLADNIRSAMAYLYEQNLARSLRPKERSAFWTELKGTVIKAMGAMRIENAYLREAVESALASLDPSASLQKIIEAAEGQLAELAKYVAELKQTGHRRARDEIVQYVNASFCDPDLCLSMLAQRFGRSEKYLSRLFREHTGIAFARFVENLRMEKAVALIKEASMTVNEVAETVGYINANTFYKAFKRVHGSHATSFRGERRQINGME